MPISAPRPKKNKVIVKTPCSFCHKKEEVFTFNFKGDGRDICKRCWDANAMLKKPRFSFSLFLKHAFDLKKESK